MVMGRWLRHALAGLLAGAAVAITPAKAETVTVGLVGAISSTHWPIYIGLTKGYFAAEDEKLNLVFFQSSGALGQQLKAGDYDTVCAGATSARFSALQSGAVDAAILLPPFNFYAESAGFTNLGLTVDYAKELPFTGTVVGRAWASAHKATLEKVLSVNAKSVAWFSDPANRAEAIAIMVEASKLKQEDVARSYDFLRKNEFFETAGRVSKAKMGALLAALKGLGDIEGSTNLERFVLPGVTQLSD